MYPPEILTKAVAAVCPDILARIENESVSDERHLWWELSCCILSSQVPYSLAIAAADAIDESGCLYSKDQHSTNVGECIYNLLSKPLNVEGKLRAYRFPKARSYQIATTHAAIFQVEGSLSSLMRKFNHAEEARTWLVAHASGIGPKQASMFLRNCGFTYDMAILDRHVLNYMSTLGIYSGSQLSVTGLAKYGKLENTLRDHASEMDCPVGLLDWAIWIVMRVANKDQEAF
ncbi:DNA lyase [Salmonella enterica subsp. enterica serovar Carno]|nr:DNA lyase [Salmonella enterica subsp. enterica serovar Carno]EKE2772181.1 DNA lyase [Salmonella enterica]